MKSLYAKILVWSILTIVLAFLGVGLNGYLIWRFSAPPTLRGGFRSGQLFADLALRSYREGGRPALQVFLEHATAITQESTYLTDNKGKDLLTGEDRSALLARPRKNLGFRFPMRPPPREIVMVSASSDDQARWIVIGRPGVDRFPTWTYFWIIAPVALLAYLFTFYLISPIRRLSDVVHRFGSGDLSARTNSRRGDEIGDLARDFDDMANRIDQLLTTERRLLQDISHELRTPLARLRFAVEVARTDPDKTEALNRIRKECDRLALLTDELLDITAAEGDPASRHLREVELASLLEEVSADCTMEAEIQKTRIAVQASQPVTIKADRELLRRALENVVRNGLRYSPRNSRLEMSLARSNGHARIAIRDHGPGVPSEMTERIFQPFFRAEADRARDTGGVGLGLSIAKRAVQWHHGSIQAENAEPGLRVSIYLPVKN